jgi:hypothetical protein
MITYAKFNNEELDCLEAVLHQAMACGYLQPHTLEGMRGLKELPGRLCYLGPVEKARGKESAGKKP